MFVTLVEPQDQGDPLETLGILVDRSDDGTRGTITVLDRIGGSHLRANVPFEGMHTEGGTHIKTSPPSYLEEPPQNGGKEESTDDTTVDTYTVGS